MSSPSNTPVSSTAASIDSASPRRQAEEPWLPEPEELPYTPWYEEKSSNLKLSDIATIKEKGGQWCDSMRDPWRCEMHWKDNVFTLTPRTPDRASSLTPSSRLCAAAVDRQSGPRPKSIFLRKSTLEDLTDFARTETPLHDDRNKSSEGRRVVADGRRVVAESTCVTLNGSGIQLAVGPQPLWLRNHNFGLAQRIMVKRLATSRHDPLGITDSACKNQLVVGTQPEETQERSRAQTPPTTMPEETPDPTPVVTIAEASSSRRRSGRPPPFDPSKDSLVASPTAVVATRYICNMAPDPDLQVLMKADDVEAIAWGGEMVKRLTRAHQKVNATSKNFDKAMSQHAEAVARLEELEAHRARELEAAKTQLESLGAELAAEKEARAVERNACSPPRRRRRVYERKYRFGRARMCWRRKATRNWLVRNWALVLRWGCHPRKCQYGTGLWCRAGRAYMFCVEELREIGQCGTGLWCSGGVATQGCASTELGFGTQLGSSPEELES
ncbi:hypothetical protein F511_31541 [Dorcoceras hygrometricum]|uniref:Uncharacterized protein n=1 Tax=Dorcoceras hygrometricum TaxID=472368 RepID=A0A2Z7BT84_9LAMI|nr:hypothetical protein F511_31541 [Dorcoceras hygrometricum]